MVFDGSTHYRSSPDAEVSMAELYVIFVLWMNVAVRLATQWSVALPLLSKLADFSCDGLVAW